MQPAAALAVLAAPLVERDRAGDGDVQRLRAADRDPARRRRARRRPEALARSAPSRNDDLSAQVDLAERRRRRARRARPAGPAGARSNGSSGTRQIEPAEARSAFGPVGSAQPCESATAAPNASAVRISVPTLPGSATCQSASVDRPRLGRRQVVAAVDADHPRRVRGGRDLREQPRLDVLARDEQLDRLGGRRRRRGPRPRRQTARACPASAAPAACGRASASRSRAS